jgi:hypothetical protein
MQAVFSARQLHYLAQAPRRYEASHDDSCTSKDESVSNFTRDKHDAI